MADLSALRRYSTGAALSDLAEQDQRTAEQRFVAENPGATFRGFASSLSGMGANDYAGEALKAEAAGDLPRASALREHATRLANEAAAYRPEITSTKDIHGLGDAWEFAKGALGQGIGSTLPAIGGAVAARVLGPRALGPLREFAGAAVPSFFQERGEAALGQMQDPAAMQAPVEQRLEAANIKGGINALLEAGVPGGVVRDFARATGKGVGRQILETSAKEGVTELGQNIVGQQAQRMVNPNVDVSGDRQANIDALLQGAIAGGGMAMPGAVVNVAPNAVERVKSLPFVQDALTKYDVTDKLRGLSRAGDDTAHVGQSIEETIANMQRADKVNPQAAQEFAKSLLADPNTPESVRETLASMDLSTTEGQKYVGDTMLQQHAGPEAKGAMDSFIKQAGTIVSKNEESPEATHEVLRAITEHIKPEVLSAPGIQRQLPELAKVLGNLTARGQEIDDSTLRAFGGFASLEKLTDDPQALLDSVAFAVGTESTLNGRFQKLNTATEDARAPEKAYFVKALSPDARAALAELTPGGQRAVYKRMGEVIDDVANGRLNEADHNSAFAQLDEVFGKDNASAVVSFYRESNGNKRDPSGNGIPGRREYIEDSDFSGIQHSSVDNAESALSETQLEAKNVFKNHATNMPFYEHERDTAVAKTKESTGSGRPSLIPYGQHVEETGGDVVAEAVRIRNELMRLHQASVNRKSDRTPQRAQWEAQQQAQIDELNAALNTKAMRRSNEAGRTASRELTRLKNLRESIGEDAHPEELAMLDSAIEQQQATVNRVNAEFKAAAANSPSSAAAQARKAVYEVLQKYNVGKVEAERGVGTITADESFLQRSRIGLKAKVRNEAEKVHFKMADGSVMALHAPSMIREARKLLIDDTGKNNAERTMNVFHAAVSAVLGRKDVAGLADESKLDATVLNNPNAKDRRDTVAKLQELDKALDVALQNKDRAEVGRLSMERELALEHLKEISGEELTFGQLRAEKQSKQEILKNLDEVKKERKQLQNRRTRLAHFVEAWVQADFNRSDATVAEIAKDLKWRPEMVKQYMEQFGVKGAIKKEFAMLRREINARTAVIMRWDEQEFSKYEHDPESNEGATDLYQSILDRNPSQMAREEEYKDYNVNEPGAAPALLGPKENKAALESMEPAKKPVPMKDRHPELKEYTYERWDKEEDSSKQYAVEEDTQRDLFPVEPPLTPKRNTPAAKALRDQRAALRKNEESTKRRRKVMDEKDALAVKEVVERLRGDKNVEVILTKTWKELGGASGAHHYNPMFRESAIYVAANAANPVSVAYHESLHDFFKKLGKDAKARALQAQMTEFAGSPAIKQQLSKLLEKHPAALKAIENSAEERLAYAFQFWATGDLRVGPKTEGFFASIAKMIRQLLGVMSQDEKVLAVFTALNTGALKNPNTVFEVLADKRMETLAEKAERVAEPIYRAGVKLFTVSTDRLRQFNSPQMSEIADLFHKDPDREGGGLGFLQKRAMVQGQWTNKLQSIFDDTTAEERRTALEELQAQKPTSELAKKIRGYLDEGFDYMQKSGVMRQEWQGKEMEWVPIRKVKDFFPRVWDLGQLRANRDQFITDLQFHGHMDAREAEDIYDKLVGNHGQEDITEGVKKIAGFTPWAQATMGRQLTFIKPANAEVFAKYQEKDLAHIMTQYTNQLVHRAEYTKVFGNGGQVLQDLFDDAKNAGLSAEELKTAAKLVQGLEGTLNWNMDEKLRNVMTGLMTYQNIILLPFTLFSNLIDPIGVGVRSGDMKEAWNALVEGMKGLVGGGNKEATQMAEDLGIIDQNNLIEAMGMVYNGKYMNRSMKKINQWFFKLNGMEAWNQRMRVAAMVAGERFIDKHHAGTSEHSARYMKELGLEKWDGNKSSDKYKEALFQFVDGAVLRPNAAQRPLWGNDPHWMLVFHLKQFTYSFQKVIMNRVAHEFSNGNTQAAWMLASYVPFMIVSDVLRGQITGGVRTTWDMGDYLMNGITRSGVLGIGNFAADALQDASFGGVPGQSFAGPTAGHAIFAAQTLGPMKDLGDLFMRSMPASPLLKSMS